MCNLSVGGNLGQASYRQTIVTKVRLILYMGRMLCVSVLTSQQIELLFGVRVTTEDGCFVLDEVQDPSIQRETWRWASNLENVWCVVLLTTACSEVQKVVFDAVSLWFFVRV